MRSIRPCVPLLLLWMCLGARPPARAAGPNRAYMDTTCAPCRDFYQYANGAWLETAKVPPSYNSIGAGRDIYDRNQVALRRLLEEVSADPAGQKDPASRKLGTLYAVLMDSARADREGLAPIQPDMQRIDAIRTRADLLREFARGNAIADFTPLGVGSEVDPKNSRMHIGALGQGGLGLPDRDYYFRTDPKSDTLRQEYVAHLGRVLVMLGSTPEQARVDAAKVMQIEVALAESSLANTQLRDPEKLYHPMTTAQLQALAPAIDWPAFFREAGVTQLAAPRTRLDVNVPAFLRRLSALVETTPIEDWRLYLKVHSARGGFSWMGQAQFDELFAISSKMTGQKQPQPRWKRAGVAVDGSLGEALGRAYVEREFPASSKARMNELVNNLRSALRQRIETRPWMGPATRKQALAKLKGIIQKIGYPDEWIDYSKLEIDPREPALVNLQRAAAFEQRRQLAKIGQPVDRHEWLMTTPTANAYYSPPTNEICFPAGILQPPLFDPQADDAVNYGAIGAVIGHELTHGFDDQGRKYDLAGNLKDWWTKRDAKEFDSRTSRLVEQYNGYLAVDTLHVDGKFTLGENLGDLGGLTVAYQAWKLSLKGKPAPRTVDGLTPEQRFFVSYGQAWRRITRPELIRTMALTDPHALPRWRVNGVVVNMPEFEKAFGCHAGDAMDLPNAMRAQIW